MASIRRGGSLSVHGLQEIFTAGRAGESTTTNPTTVGSSVEPRLRAKKRIRACLALRGYQFRSCADRSLRCDSRPTMGDLNSSETFRAAFAPGNVLLPSRRNRVAAMPAPLLPKEIFRR